MKQPKMSEHWSDISNAPLAPGDILKIYNETTETARTFQFLEVEEDDVGDKLARKISARLIDTTDPRERVGIDLTFSLPRHEPIMGALIRMDERYEQMSSVEVADLVAVELYKWLMGRGLNNYSSSFKGVVQFLIDGGFIPRDEEYNTSRNRVRKILKQRPELLRSVGGVVYASGVDAAKHGSSPSSKQIGGNIVVVRRVKLSKLFMGIRLILESGAFGDLVIEE